MSNLYHNLITLDPQVVATNELVDTLLIHLKTTLEQLGASFQTALEARVLLAHVFATKAPPAVIQAAETVLDHARAILAAQEGAFNYSEALVLQWIRAIKRCAAGDSLDAPAPFNIDESTTHAIVWSQQRMAPIEIKMTDDEYHPVELEVLLWRYTPQYKKLITIARKMRDHRQFYPEIKELVTTRTAEYRKMLWYEVARATLIREDFDHEAYGKSAEHLAWCYRERESMARSIELPVYIEYLIEDNPFALGEIFTTLLDVCARE